jgi:hypothetical protein
MLMGYELTGLMSGFKYGGKIPHVSDGYCWAFAGYEGR